MIRIVVAEDNAGDVVLIREALNQTGIAYELIVLRDGQKMLHYLDQMDAGEVLCPDVVLLDLNLPKKSGEVLLARLRQSPVGSQVPVVVVTSSDLTTDREKMTRLGANSYFRKSSDYDEFMQLGSIVKKAVTGGAERNSPGESGSEGAC